jgi:hypothetical protein
MAGGRRPAGSGKGKGKGKAWPSKNPWRLRGLAAPASTAPKHTPVETGPTWSMMRIRMLRSRPLFFPALAVAACSTFAPPTNVHILRVPEGDRAVQEEGTNLKLTRWDLASAREGLKRGDFVVKSDLEWRGLWPRIDSDKVPLLPFDIDFGREMLLVSSPMTNDTTASQIKTVVETDRSVHVYVTEVDLGVDCPSTPDTSAKSYDLVRVQRIDDKDVTFHLDSEFGEACGKPPSAALACKPDNTQTPLAPKLTVEPATKIACLVSGLESSRPVFDLTWVWDSIPLGSVAKIDVAKGSRGVTFIPEVIGTYRLALEVSDDLARKGTVTIDVDVAPSASPLSLQMVWTRLDANDDPSTFPRVDLHAFGLSLEAPKPNKPVPRLPQVVWGAVKDCAIAAANSSIPATTNPPWCTAKNAGSTTIMTLDPLAAKDYALGVHYADERIAGQPVLCIRAYRDGKMQAERCDTDKRSADSWWDAGVIDSKTGKTMEMAAQELAAAQAKVAAAATPAKPDAGPADAAPAAPNAKP